ncbi:MAG: glycosyltransferase family 9 protein [Ignavibacteria bacterium]|nr:glycosyltransferase family 9 protein [Ignavibacteria bacterium]
MREVYKDLLSKKEVKVLVSRTDKIGDVILSLPLINEIKRLIPKSRITFLISNRLENLIEGYRDIDSVVYFEKFEGQKEFIDFLEAGKFDAAISVFPRSEIASAFYRSKIRIRVGTSYRWYSFLFNYRIKEHRKYSEKHESDYNLNLLKFLTDDISYEKKFYFTYTDTEFQALQNKLASAGFDINSKFLIIHPGSKGSAYDLPVEKMIDLSSKINNRHEDYIVVITGSENEKELADKFADERGGVFNAAGLINLRELMILIDKCSLFISNSTGPIHIAGALNKSIAGFYPNSAPMNSERWGPLSNNALIIRPDDGDDMDKINTDEVLEKISRLLE